MFKKYYIIRRPEPGAGFFSNYLWVLGHTIFARKLNYIPIVDMKYYKTLYNEDVPVDGELNAWNYYFENDENVSIDEVLNGNKYVLGQQKYLSKYLNKFSSSIYGFPTKEMINYFYPIIEENIRIKNDIIENFEMEWKNLKLNENDKIVGIHFRGTDMRNGKWNHPVPSAFENYLVQAEALLNMDSKINKIFLATDELGIVTKYIEYFQGKNICLFYNDVFRASEADESNTGIHLLLQENTEKLHKYRLGMDVLKDAYFLSKCDYLICGHSNVSNVAIIWNNKRYEKLICV
ncbi:MAG: hypothetical protein J1E98_03060 [Lachnospiraceae bacterium]|nr:hypothetical protein [Lachnospiraceae bacterium]